MFRTIAPSLSSSSLSAALAALPLALLAPVAAEAAMPITGVWARGDGNAHVRIEPCGPNVCATNIWVKPGRKDEAVGDTLVMMVKPESEKRYAGKAYDKRRKLTYSMEIDVKPNVLSSRGCLLAGLACKSISWQRLK